MPFSISVPDLLLHALAYGLLAGLLYLSMKHSGVSRYLIVTSFVIVVLYGISDEIHQYFVSGRNADIWDVVADATGGLVCLLILRKLTAAVGHNNSSSGGYSP